MQENSMTINFQVNNQTLVRTTSNNVVENSENYLFTQFTFSEDWNGTTRYAIVEGNDLRYKVLLDDEDKCKIPSSIIKHNGFSIMVVGENANNLVVITTRTLFIPVYKTGYVEAEHPDIKYVTSSDDSIEIEQTGDSVDIKIPNIYFKDVNLTNDILNFIGRDNTILKSINMPYGLLNNITLNLDQTTYTLTLTGLDKNDNVLFTRTADFNIETKVFKTIYYDTQTKELVFVTMDDEQIRVPIGDILTGIATQDWVISQLQNYVQKESGKGLSTNDYSNEEKAKLSGIEEGAEKNKQSDWNEQDSTKDEFIRNKPHIPTKTSDLTNDSDFIDSSYHDNTKQDVINAQNKLNADYVEDTNSTHKFVSAEEKAQITTNKNDIIALENSKQDTLSGSSSIDITSNVVSVKQSYIDSQFLSNTERQEIIDEIMEVFE